MTTRDEFTTGAVAGTLVLSDGDVARCLDIEQLAARLDSALFAPALSRRMVVPLQPGALHIVAGGSTDDDVATYSIKANVRRERIRGVVIVADAATGVIDGIVASPTLTVRRTAVAVALCARRLDPVPQRVAVVGDGRVGVSAAESLRRLVPSIEHVDLHDPLAHAASGASESGSGIDLTSVDLVVTATPSTAPILTEAAVGSRFRIIAVGADAPGKRELSANIVDGATFACDDVEQCANSGELQHADPTTRSVGLDQLATIAPSTPRLVVDLTGIAIQDAIAGRLALERALADDLGVSLELFDG